MGAAGTRERIIAAHKYRHHKKAARPSRTMVAKGRIIGIQTFKKKGDLILNGKLIKVNQDGWF